MSTKANFDYFHMSSTFNHFDLCVRNNELETVNINVLDINPYTLLNPNTIINNLPPSLELIHINNLRINKKVLEPIMIKDKEIIELVEKLFRLPYGCKIKIDRVITQ